MQHSVLLLFLSCCVAAALAADSPFNATLWSVVIVILLLLGAITLAAIVVLVLWIRLQMKERHDSESTRLQESHRLSSVNPSHVKEDEEEEEEKFDLHYSLAAAPATRSTISDHSFTSDVDDLDRYVPTELNHNTGPAAELGSDLRPPDPSLESEDFSQHVYTEINRKAAGKKAGRRPPPVPPGKEGRDGGGVPMTTELLQAFEKGRTERKEAAKAGESVPPPIPAKMQFHPPVPPVKPKAREEEQSPSPARLRPVPPAKPKPYDPPAAAAKLKPVPPTKPKPEEPPIAAVKLKPTPPAKPTAASVSGGPEEPPIAAVKLKPTPPAKPTAASVSGGPEEPLIAAVKLKPTPPAKPTAASVSGGPEEPPIAAVKLKPTPPAKPTAASVNDGGKPQPPSKPASTLQADLGGLPKPKPRPAPAPRQAAEVQSHPASPGPKPLAKPRVPAKPLGGPGGVANGDVVESAPVMVEKFGDHVASLHANNNAGFLYQYDALPSGEEGHLITDGISPEQSSRNRFYNIVPYNDNRIKLKPIPGQNDYQHNYVNASYIDGLSSPHKYIATQGPLPETVVDFWRLVWQEKVPTIAMLTGLHEQGSKKCERYWPEYGTAEYGPYSVTLAEQQVLADYTFSTLELQFNARGSRSPSPRKVRHLQFTSWPDHECPPQAGPYLVYFRRLRALHVPKNGPLLVHCSAGVGRTGTLLAIGLALEQAGKDGLVDVPSIITNLRKQRMKMVQSQEQHMFIHDAVLEQLICGNTHIPTPDLRRTLEKLKQEELKDGKFKTGYAIQFDVLEQVSPKPKEVLSRTAQQCPTKNRTMEFLPSDSERVALKRETPGYIHASFANGYKKKNAFIIAQAPMEETCRDFWKMVYERECGVIVMLSELAEKGEELCARYWAGPRDRHGRTYAEFSVHTIEQQHNTGYTTRRMGVTDSRTGQEHQVVQFQIPVWAADGTCKAPLILVDTLHQITVAQRKSGNKPIVVHGSDTVSRCGVFCALMNAIECCKTEGEVDVFQAVKALRLQKPGSVRTMAQYQTLFDLMVTFLDSFDTYANFK